MYLLQGGDGALPPTGPAGVHPGAHGALRYTAGIVTLAASLYVIADRLRVGQIPQRWVISRSEGGGVAKGNAG